MRVQSHRTHPDDGGADPNQTQAAGDHPGIDDNLRELRTGELTRLISVCGLVQSDHVAGDISVPPALLTRIARHLENAASIAADATLGDVLRRDATAARQLAG